MANSSTPYRRVGSNSFQELLDQVNNELENPPDPGSCDPLPPIEPPPECDRWAKSEIREIHDALKQMPTDCFDFEPIPDLWKVSIITDIENQLGNAWCDCEDEEICCEPCTNAGDAFDVFLGSITCCKGCKTPCDDDIFCAERACQSVRCDPISSPVTPYFQWKASSFQACVLEGEVDDLNEEIADLEDVISGLEQDISDLQTARSNCAPGESGDGCRASIDAQIDAKETEKDTKETELEEKETELAEKETELAEKEAQRDAQEADFQSSSAELLACWSGCCGGEACLNCLIDDLPTDNPAGNVTCTCETINDQNGECPSCFSCDTGWSFQEKVNKNNGIGSEPTFRTIFSGVWSYRGELVAFDEASDWCECALKFGCCCTKLNIGGTGERGPCSNCDADSGGRCPRDPDKGGRLHEWKLRVRPPRTFDPFDSADGTPCDGIPGEEGGGDG